MSEISDLVDRLRADSQSAHQATVERRCQETQEWLRGREAAQERADARAQAELDSTDLVAMGAEVQRARVRIDRAASYGEAADPTDRALITRFDSLCDRQRRSGQEAAFAAARAAQPAPSHTDARQPWELEEETRRKAREDSYRQPISALVGQLQDSADAGAAGAAGATPSELEAEARRRAYEDSFPAGSAPPRRAPSPTLRAKACAGASCGAHAHCAHDHTKCDGLGKTFAGVEAQLARVQRTT